MFILFVFFFSGLLHAQVQNESLPFRSGVEIKKFADHLYCSQEYLRAIDEYNILLNQSSNDILLYRITLSSIQLMDWGQAFLSLRKITSDSLKLNAGLQYYRALFSTEQYPYLINEYEKKELSLIESKESVQRLYLFSKLLLHQQVETNEIQSLTAKLDEYSALYSRIDALKNPSYKNPLIATLLSVIVPGAGKIYTRQYSDGITAFILTGLFGYLTYANYHAKHYPRVWIFSGCTAFFYAGSIYGSAASAHLYNASLNYSLALDLTSFLNDHSYYVTGDEDMIPCK